MILGRRSSFCCHVTDGDVAPAFCVREKKGGGGGGELADLCALSPVSVHRCWPSFVSGGVVRIPSWAFFVICRHLGGCWGK